MLTRARKILGSILACALVVTNLALAAWLARDLWLPPIARAEVRTILGDALDADVEIGAISGSLLRGLAVDGIQIRARSPDGAVRLVEDGRLEVSYDLARLIGGDLGGLRAVRIRARRVEIRIPPGSDQPGDPPSGDLWPDSDALRPILAAAPDGARLEIDELTVSNTDGTVISDGPAVLSLAPRPMRTLTLETGSVRVEPSLIDDGLFHIDIEIVDPNDLVAALGTDLPLGGGHLRVGIDGDLDDRDLRAQVTWEGGRLRGRGPSSMSGSVQLRETAVQLELDAAGPGGTARIRDFAVPLADIDELLRVGRGSLEVELLDLEPWRSLLPVQVADQLPIQGMIHAELHGQGLDVEHGWLRGRTLAADVYGGRLPIGAQRPVAFGGARIGAKLTASAPYVIELDDGEIVVEGTIEGEVSGSLDAPHVTASLDLREGAAFGQSWSSLRAELAWRDDVIQLTSVDASGIRPTGVVDDLGGTLLGDLTITLPADDQRGLSIGVEVSVEGPTEPWLATHAPEVAPAARRDRLRASVSVSIEFDGSPLPVGDVALIVDSLTHAGGGAGTRGTLRAKTRPESDGTQRFEAGFVGDLHPELLAAVGVDTAPWEVAGPAAVEARVEGDLLADDLGGWAGSVGVQGLEIGDLAALRLEVAARSDSPSTGIEVSTLSVSGPFTLHANGTIPTEGDDDLTASIDLDVPDTATLAPLFPDLPTGARLRATADLRGRLDAPQGRLSIDAEVADGPSSLGRFWPETLGPMPPGPVTLRLSAVTEGGGVQIGVLEATLGPRSELGDQRTGQGLPIGAPGRRGASLTASGLLPMRWSDAGLEVGDGILDGEFGAALDVPRVGLVSARTALRWSRHALVLDGVHLTDGRSEAHGRLELDAPPLRLLGVDVGEVPIAGSLDVRELDISQLAGPTVLGGFIDVDLRLAGTTLAPLPTGEVRLRDGRFKVAGDIPTIANVQLVLAADTSEVRIERLDGEIGGGTFAVTRGLLRRPDGGSLLEDIATARVDLELQAEDALLLRATGRKLRADARLTCVGPLDQVLIAGSVTVTSGKIIQRISLVPDLGTRGGNAVGTGIDLFELPPPFGEATRFDVAIRTAKNEPIDVVTHVFNAPLSVSLWLRGSGTTPYLEGAISAETGSLRLPAVTMGVQQALIRFTADDPRHPELRVSAGTRRHGIDVNATAMGRIDQVEVLLSSIPPMTQEELVVLVSTGVLPRTLQDQGIGGRAQMVGGYLAQEIFDFYFGSDSTEQGEAFLDRLHLHSGREISKNGVESLVVEFGITDSIALEGERDIYEDYNMGVLYRIRF